VRPEGFEPPIPAFGGLCVIQLRYGRTRRINEAHRAVIQRSEYA
jgi:hypothetical protein